MGLVRYRVAAEEDLYDISIFTVQGRNIKEADQYIADIEELCELLSNFPRVGRRCEEVCEGLRRMEYKSYVIFFFEEPHGIRVSRVLHKNHVPFDEEFYPTA